MDGRYSPSHTGAGVHIYVLDTGARTSHTAFAGRVGGGADCTRGGCRPSAAPVDDNGHGTHTAGTALGACFGVAQGATLHAVKVLNADGAGPYSQIIDGLRWVVQDARAGGWPAVAVLSLGGDRSKSLDDAVAATVGAGVTVVVAAGNDFGADACAFSPSGAAAAITVAATDRADKPADFSDVGHCVDIWAPGVGIVSAGIASDTATKQLSGTSMAAPAVAGALALLLQGAPGAGPAQLADALKADAVQRRFVDGTTTAFLQVKK